MKAFIEKQLHEDRGTCCVCGSISKQFNRFAGSLVWCCATHTPEQMYKAIDIHSKEILKTDLTNINDHKPANV